MLQLRSDSIEIEVQHCRINPIANVSGGLNGDVRAARVGRVSHFVGDDRHHDWECELGGSVE